MPRPSLGRLSERARAKTYLAAWRQFRGLSQEQAAERIGIERSSLSKLESGSTSYTQHVLEAIAEAYDCTPADLIARDPNGEEPISIFDLDVGEKRQVQAYIDGIRAAKTSKTPHPAPSRTRARKTAS